MPRRVHDMSFAQRRSSRPSSPMMAVTGRRASPRLGVRGQSPSLGSAGDFDALPTDHLVDLKRSIDEKLAERRGARVSYRDDDDGAYGPPSVATVDYNDRPSARPTTAHVGGRASPRPTTAFATAERASARQSFRQQERPGSAGSGTFYDGNPSNFASARQRPASAGRARPSARDQMVVPPRRPITPTRDSWDQQQRSTRISARDTAGIRDDVDIFSNDRRPSYNSMARPHSARPASVAGKVGALTVGGKGMLNLPMRLQPQPPKAGAFKVRKELMKGISLLRRFYDRSDLPICVKHCPQENEINWKVEPEKLDYHYYLPIFFDGLRDKEDPYFFFARRGILDMIERGPQRIVAVLPQLIIFVKNALNTRDPDIVQTTLKILQTMVKADERIGESLVPYYRQLLPIFNLLKAKNKNSGDNIDYSQRKRSNIGELIHETLEMFEMYGGPDAYINIKYMIPTYESCMVV